MENKKVSLIEKVADFSDEEAGLIAGMVSVGLSILIPVILAGIGMIEAGIGMFLALGLGFFLFGISYGFYVYASKTTKWNNR